MEFVLPSYPLLVLVSGFLLFGAPPVAGAPPQQPVLDVEADAGPDQFLLPPATSLTLDATVTGVNVSQVPSGTRITWVQLSGPPATIAGANTLRPIVTPSHPGRIRLLLKVVDPAAGSDWDMVVITAFGAEQNGLLHGDLRKWHKLMLTFPHDVTLSEGGAINPFLDLRLVTTFYHPASGALYEVPGFFAADGNAADTGGTEGTRFRVQFTPDRSGTWYYLASFRSGSQIAIDLAPETGEPASFDGANGKLEVAPADPAAPGFLSKGRLEHVGKHHLRFAETGESYLKNGAGSPENFLAYYEFDDTLDLGGPTSDLNLAGYFDGLHHYDAHLGDFVDLGVSTWRGGGGQRIFGVLNYLASRGVNSLYTLTYNLDGGDGRDVWPWFPSTNKLRYDVSKLTQWQRVVDHMTRAGIVWHVITQEVENDEDLDGGALGVQRKLYYRELVARFAHAPGLVWNLGEENQNTTAQRIAFADYIRALDPYDHPIALHNGPGDLQPFTPLLGTHLELASLQGDPVVTALQVRELVDDSAAAGRPWAVAFDEQNPASDGAVPDADDFWHDLMRREALWPTLLGQGSGVEWYFGYSFPHNDLDCEDFRSRENLFDLTARALDFLRGHVPFEDMQHADLLATGNGPSVLAERGEFYLVYLPFGGTSTLNLEGHTGPFRVSWFDARNGGALANGTVTQVSGPGQRSLGLPPGSGDRVAFVRRTANFAPAIESLTVEPGTFEGGQDFAVQVHARDPNGPSDALSVEIDVYDPENVRTFVLTLPHRGGSLYSYFLPAAPALAPGTWQVRATVVDEAGLSAAQITTFEAR